MADLEGTYSGYLPVSPKTACEAVVNVADYPRWWSRSVVTTLTKGVNGKAMVGSRLEVKLEKITFDYEVKKLEMGKRIDLDCVGGSYRGTAAWTFEPEGNGTRVSYRVSLRPHGLLMKALGRTVDAGAIHERVIVSSLERLAANLAG